MAGLQTCIRVPAIRALKLLHESGVQTVMLTGDNKFTADAVARQLRIDTVIAEVLINTSVVRDTFTTPEELAGDKADEVKKLQAKVGRSRWWEMESTMLRLLRRPTLDCNRSGN